MCSRLKFSNTASCSALEEWTGDTSDLGVCIKLVFEQWRHNGQGSIWACSIQMIRSLYTYSLLLDGCQSLGSGVVTNPPPPIFALQNEEYIPSRERSSETESEWSIRNTTWYDRKSKIEDCTCPPNFCISACMDNIYIYIYIYIYKRNVNGHAH